MSAGIGGGSVSEVTLHLGDCLDVLRTLPDNSVDSIVTDPPYELGFMNKRWDSTGIAYDVNVWRQCLRVLKPGGHLLAFGGSRTYHRLACAVEDAGFEIRDQIMWVYGSGFPKSLDVSKAIDKAAGAERERTGRRRVCQGTPIHKNGSHTSSPGWARPWMDAPDEEKETLWETLPATPDALRWQGWGTALKPAHEPLVMARKPLAERTVAANVLKWGCGALNVDGCRVEAPDGVDGGRDFDESPLLAGRGGSITPPGGVVLDPFTGSGSTGKAAVLEGFGFVGIEKEAEYLAIAERRIEHARMQPSLLAEAAE